MLFRSRVTWLGLYRRAQTLEPHRPLVSPAPPIAIAIVQHTEGVVGPRRVQIRAATSKLRVPHLQHQIAAHRIDERAAAPLSKHALAEYSRGAKNLERTC